MHKDETDGGRKVLGKKGLGKLSMFGIGKKITISTVKSGIKNTFVMDYEQLKDSEGNVYKPTVIDYCIKTDEKNGTSFFIEHLSRKSDFDIERLHRNLQTRFHIYSDKFVVHINDDEKYEINSNDIPEDKCQFVWKFPEDFEKDLKKALSLNIQHISLYGLKIDEGCYFYNNIPDNLPDEDMQADMYLKAIEILTSHGFCHYEISNFSKNEYESKHNLNYWDNNNYYGFGAAAHGYTDGKRYSNKCNIKNYIENPIEHESTHTLTQQEKLEEEIFLGFRKMSGTNIYNINKKYNIDFLEKYSATLNKYTSLKYLSETNTGFKLTDSGILLSNLILSEFIE